MARPALIVGLGGTGQWVLTWLKRELLLANNGHMPDNVRLLAIDTEPQQIEADWRHTIRVESAKVGGVTLDKTEFIHIGYNLQLLAKEIAEGKHPHLSRWYRARYWLNTLPPAVFAFDNRAGRIRQFGRLAVYKDTMHGDRKLWNAFRDAISIVRGKTDYERRLEIIVVGSFAGGTGSGMFLDVALILRKLAKEISPHHVLRGFFALPSVFTANPSVDMKACAFAAWRELNRFMVIDSDFPMSSIDYVRNSSKYNIVPENRIFDVCHLVDGRRGDTQLAAEARFGAFPMISEMISAILDERAGQVYSEWVYTSLASVYAMNPHTPMYNMIQVVGSEDPFKLTLVRSDDLYNYDEFAAWEECQAAYAAHVNDKDGLMRPVNLHNFAAEANAVEFETRLMREGEEAYRPLHQQVVMLLENPELLRQFLYLLILGNITEVQDRTAHRWELNWERSASLETIYLTRPWREDAWDPRPNIFHAAHGYAIRQRSQEEYSRAVVDIDHARIYISDALAKAGSQAVLDILNHELNGEGKIGELERAARGMGNNMITHPDLNDLAIVFRMMLQDDIKRQENLSERARRLHEEEEVAETDRAAVDDESDSMN